jgi:integrase/recombinase XerD
MVTSYQRFFEAIKTPKTRTAYQIYIKKFLDYAHSDYDGIVKLSQSDIEDLVFNYLIHLKDLTARTGKPNPNSYNPMIAPIKLFFEMNDIILNWTKIKKLFPTKLPTSNQSPYDGKDIKELLEATTNIRNKAFIHFLASTGCRVGAIPDLNIEDVKPIEDGAIVTLYRNTTEEYRSCLTPEAYHCLKKYLAQRLNVRPIDPLFTDKGNVTRIGAYGASDMIRYVRSQAKLSVDNGRKSTRGKSQNHAFRKRFSICLANANIQSKFIDDMIGHYQNQDKYYFRGASDEDIWIQFKKAIPQLTIDDTERLKLKHESEKQELSQKIPDIFKEKFEALEEQMEQLRTVSAIKNFRNITRINSREQDIFDVYDFNDACRTLGRPDGINLTASKKMLFEVKTLKQFKDMKKGILEGIHIGKYSNESLELIEKIIDQFADMAGLESTKNN